MKNNKFCTYSALFVTTCTKRTLNFLLQRCFEDKHRGKFNFFPESELGCGPQDSIGKFTYICHLERDEINAKKLQKEKTRAIILIAKDVFVALSVIVAEAHCIHEIDSSILVYCKLVLSKKEKHPDSLDKLFTLQNMANLQDIGFTLDFGFKIYRHLFNSYSPTASNQKRQTNPVTKLPGKVRSLKLHVRQTIDMHQSMDPNTRQSILQVANVISYMQKRLLSFGELFVPLKKILATPLTECLLLPFYILRVFVEFSFVLLCFIFLAVLVQSWFGVSQVIKKETLTLES